MYKNAIPTLVVITLLLCTYSFAEENNKSTTTSIYIADFEFPPGAKPYPKELQLELNKKKNNAAVHTSLVQSIYSIVERQNTLTDYFWNQVHIFFNTHITQ